MRLLSSLSLLFLALVGLASAKSAAGNRLLVVLEDDSQRGLYAKFWADLEGDFIYWTGSTETRNTDESICTAREFELSFESPRNEELSLFRHGQLAYEHLLLTPPKSKGAVLFFSVTKIKPLI